jgi:hypothetical protein
MSFFTIFVPDGLSERDYRRALKSGPTFVSSRRVNHRELLAAAGFSSVEEIDLTAEFAATTRGWLEGRARYRAELVGAEGAPAFEERQADSTAQLAAIEAGLLRRGLFVCEL